MSTHSTIALEHEDGSITGVYCQFDGYLRNNGKILFEHYKTKELVELLLAKGDMSVLRMTPGTSEYYDVDARLKSDYKAFLEITEQEYNYLFNKDGEWEEADRGHLKNLDLENE